jgi:hypothetical protein
MKKLTQILLSLFFALSVFPLLALAQDDPPPPPPNPPCCAPREPGLQSIVAPGSTNTQTVQAQISIPLSMLQIQGISQSQFVDRLSQSLFPGRDVEVIIATKRNVRENTLALANNQGLVAIQQTLYYRYQRSAVATEDLDRLNQIGLTDGTSYVNVTFVDDSASSSMLTSDLR